MAEQMTSREDATYMSEAILGLVDDLERDGFTRSQIGAAMIGGAFGIITAHNGRKHAGDVLDTLRAQLATAGA